MTVAQRQRLMQHRVIGHFGDRQTVTLRRRHTLMDHATGAILAALLVNGGQSSGAAVINLRAAKLQGRIVKGVQFQIAGDATVYTVGGPVEASSNALAAVQISPVLAQNAADGAVVTITRAYGDHAFPRLRGELIEEDADGAQLARSLVIYLSAEGAAITPTNGDVVVGLGTIADVKAWAPGGSAVRFDVLVGGVA